MNIHRAKPSSQFSLGSHYSTRNEIFQNNLYYLRGISRPKRYTLLRSEGPHPHALYHFVPLQNLDLKSPSSRNLLDEHALSIPKERPTNHTVENMQKMQPIVQETQHPQNLSKAHISRACITSLVHQRHPLQTSHKAHPIQPRHYPDQTTPQSP